MSSEPESKSPYRSLSPPKPASKPRRMLRCSPGPAPTSRTFRWIFVLPCGGSLVLGAYYQFGALVALAVFGLFAWLFAANAKRSEAGAILVVENGQLAVLSSPEAIVPLMKLPLEALSNVELETKNIQKVEDGGSAAFAMTLIDSKVGPEVGYSHVVLRAEDGETHSLFAERLPHVEAVKWLGKIRVFLRSHGWVPQDERV